MVWHTTYLRQLVRLEAEVGCELVLLRADLDEHQSINVLMCGYEGIPVYAYSYDNRTDERSWRNKYAVLTTEICVPHLPL